MEIASFIFYWIWREYITTARLVGNAVGLDVFLNFRLVIAVITQGIKDLSQRQMWQVIGNSFGVRAQTPDFDNRTNRRARIFDNRLAAKNPIMM